jgi:hypothetical protein
MRLTRNEIVLLADHVMKDIGRRHKGTFVIKKRRKASEFNPADADIAEKAVTKLVTAVVGGSDTGVELPQNWLFELQDKFPGERPHF